MPDVDDATEQSGSRFFARLTRAILRGRWALLLLVAALTGLLASRLDELQFDASNEAWLIEGDATLALIEKFTALFGNDDFVYILYDAGDFFRAEPVRRLAALADELEARVPHLVDITWLGNAEWIEAREEEISVEPLMDPLPDSADRFERIRHMALSEPTFVDSLISADGAVAGLLLEMDAYPEDGVDPRKDVPPVVREILAEPEHADLAAVAVGGPLLDYDLDMITASEGLHLGILCLIVQMGVLVWVGRGLRAVMVPATVVGLSVVWTFGLIAMLGFTLNMVAILVPVILICVGIGDSMHVIAEFQDQRRRGLARHPAMARAMALVGWPCVLTSLTTAAGFLSFLAADIRPFRELGQYAAAGAVAAVVLTFVLVPTLYSWGRESAGGRGPRAASGHDPFDRMLRACARLVARRPGALAAFFSCLLVLSLLGYTQVEVESNVIHMFSEDVPIRQAYDRVDARMGGSMSMEIMLDSGRPDGVLEPDFLRHMDELDRFVTAHDLTTKTTSLLDILRKMRKAFHENGQEYYDIPESRAEASQYILLYEMSGGEEKEKLLTFDNDVARLTARTRALDTADVRRFVHDVKSFAASRFGGDSEIELTGTLAWARSLTDLIGQGQRQSFAAALIAISIMMMLVMRSVRLGLISMLPNVFPVLIILGTMGFAGIYMDMTMMTFSAIIIGVAVDDTIHFFVRFRREFEHLGRYAPAIEATLTTVGRPISFTTLTLTLGFAVLAASDIASLNRFGIFSGIAFSWALLADFLFAPALLILLKPLGPERGSEARDGGHHRS